VQEFLWYQLPTKFAVPVTEQRKVAHALGALFDRVGLPRYAELCTCPVTDTVLTAYNTGGRTPGSPCTGKPFTLVVSNHPRSLAC
jgi:hypothetical protein